MDRREASQQDGRLREAKDSAHYGQERERRHRLGPGKSRNHGDARDGEECSGDCCGAQAFLPLQHS